MIEQILEKLPKDILSSLKTGSDFVVKRQPTPSLGMNMALNGGLAFGRQALIWGSKSAGKSSFCLQMIADAQAAGRNCAWIDAENSFDSSWARLLGVDTDNLIVTRAHKVNDAVDIGIALMTSGIDILVIDSISALMPAIYFDKKNDELKDLSETKQMGGEARDLANAIKMLNYSNDDTLLIMISQQRKNLGTMYVRNIPTGGEAIKFFSSTIIRMNTSESESKAIKDVIPLGNRDIETAIGREVTWLVEANKLGPAFETGTFHFMFQGEHLGVDHYDEAVSLAELAGTVVKSGSWYKYDEEKYLGRDSLVKELRNNPDMYGKIVNAFL